MGLKLVRKEPKKMNVESTNAHEETSFLAAALIIEEKKRNGGREREREIARNFIDAACAKRLFFCVAEKRSARHQNKW